MAATMESTRVFLVVGEESDYDINERWVVATWEVENHAIEHCDKATKYAEEHHFDDHPAHLTVKDRLVAKTAKVNPYDPEYGWSNFGAGVSYYVETIEPFVVEI